MKKYALSIEIPLNRTLKLECCLDELLNSPDVYCYSRHLKKDDTSTEILEVLKISFYL